MSFIQGERGRDLGEVAEPLFEVVVGSSSSSGSVLAGGVTIWLGDSVHPREDPLRFFLDLGRIKSEDRLRGLGGVTNPEPIFDASENTALDRFRPQLPLIPSTTQAILLHAPLLLDSCPLPFNSLRIRG